MGIYGNNGSKDNFDIKGGLSKIWGQIPYPVEPTDYKFGSFFFGKPPPIVFSCFSGNKLNKLRYVFFETQ